MKDGYRRRRRIEVKENKDLLVENPLPLTLKKNVTLTMKAQELFNAADSGKDEDEDGGIERIPKNSKSKIFNSAQKII